MSLTLRQLAVFEATVRLGRLTAAAEEQALSQSAASQSLKELETTLSYPLFTRVGRDLLLTDQGRHILPDVMTILRLAGGLKRPDAGKISGPLKVAASVTIASYLLPRLLADFVERHPQVTPELQIHNTDRVIETLEKGQAQIGLIEGPALHHDLKILPWADDRLDIFCHVSHPLAKAGRLTPQQIADQRWILREKGSGTRTIFVAALQQLGLGVRATMDLSQQEAIKQAVKAGLGIGCLSRLSIVEELRAGEFVVLHTPLNLSRKLSIVHSPLYEQNPLVRRFGDFLVAEAGRIEQT